MINNTLRIGKGILIFGIGFLGGYSFHKYVQQDERYEIRRINKVPYLADKVRREMLVIDEKDFQVGDVEHRVAGLVEEPGLVEVLEKIRRKYGG